MDNEAHPLVELLRARMVSHPEEFEGRAGYHRWSSEISMVEKYGTENDKSVLREALHRTYLDNEHVAVMKKMLDGEDPKDIAVDASKYHYTAAQQMQHQIDLQKLMQQQQALNQRYITGTPPTPVYPITTTSGTLTSSSSALNNLGTLGGLRNWPNP